MDDRWIVMRRSVAHESDPLCHESIGDIQAELGFGLDRVTSVGGETKLFPPSDTQLGPGDELLVEGPNDDLVTLQQRDVNLAVGPRTRHLSRAVGSALDRCQLTLGVQPRRPPGRSTPG